MSKSTDLSKEYESANNGPENKFEDPEVKDEGEEGEESDEYEEIDDEEERQIAGDEDDEDEGEGEPQSKLTHLLIGNPNGATAGNEAKCEEFDEFDEGDDDEDDEDDEYVEEEDDPAHPNPLNKKRSIDEVADKEAQGSKKIKA